MSATRDNVKRLLKWTRQHNDDLESFEPVWLSSSQIKELLHCIDVTERLEALLREGMNNEGK